MKEDALVRPNYEREDDAAPGAFYVEKDMCITCGIPMDTAPANFSWSDRTRETHSGEFPHHCRVFKQPETPEELERVIEAASMSEIDAIRYCGTDPEILQRFKERGLKRLCDALSEKRRQR
jgi:ferredoxin